MKKKIIIGMIVTLIILALFEPAINLLKNDNTEMLAKADEKVATNELSDIDNTEIEIDNTEIETTEESKTGNDVGIANVSKKNIAPQIEQKPITPAPVTSSQNKVEVKKETVNTPVVTKKEDTKQDSEQKKQVQTQTKPVVQETKEDKQTTNDALKCTKDKHFADVGNTGEWFDTQEKAIAYYMAEITKLDNELNSKEITYKEYLSRCPYRYEVWSCLCGKWTISFDYR